MTREEFWRSSPFKIVLLWDEYRKLNGTMPEEEKESNVVERDGKAYKKVTANAEWANDIF